MLLSIIAAPWISRAIAARAATRRRTRCRASSARSQIGVDTLELDVGVTRDGVVVIHHDRRLNPDVARGADGKWVARTRRR